MKKYSFEFISTYQGSSDYRVYERGTRNDFRLTLDNETEQIRRLCDEHISEELLNEFNEWRLDKHEHAKEYCTARGYDLPDEFIPVTAKNRKLNPSEYAF